MKRVTLATVLLVSLLSSGVITASSIENLQYETEHGKLESFNNYLGSFLLVEIFATWCENCKQQHEALNLLWNDLREEINFLSLASDEKDSLDEIKKFSEAFPIDWDLGLDINQSFRSNYNVQGYPTFLLFNPEGALKVCQLGVQSYSDLFDLTENVLDNSTGSIELCPGSDQFSLLYINLGLGLLVSIIIGIYYVIIGKKKRTNS